MSVKIFVSYYRVDGTDFVMHIYEYMKNLGHDVFVDTNNIQAGDPWSIVIEQNISICDIFLVIVTPGTLRSREVEREVLLAQERGKKIIPCVHGFVLRDQLKWGLDKIQGIRFSDKYDLALYLSRTFEGPSPITIPDTRNEPNPNPFVVYIIRKLSITNGIILCILFIENAPYGLNITSLILGIAYFVMVRALRFGERLAWTFTVLLTSIGTGFLILYFFCILPVLLEVYS